MSANKANSLSIRIRALICQNCQKDFWAKPNQKYCNTKCNRQAYYKRNIKIINKRNKIYRQRNFLKIAEQQKLWQTNNKEKIKLYRSTPTIKLSINLRSRLSKALKRQQKTCSAVRDLGCSLEELKSHLESKFTSGMSWNNYGSGWHIDHIRPLALAVSEEEVLKLCHYSNLQPLWAKDNLSKGDNYEFFNQKMFNLFATQ